MDSFNWQLEQETVKNLIYKLARSDLDLQPCTGYHPWTGHRRWGSGSHLGCFFSTFLSAAGLFLPLPFSIFFREKTLETNLHARVLLWSSPFLVSDSSIVHRIDLEILSYSAILEISGFSNSDARMQLLDLPSFLNDERSSRLNLPQKMAIF